MSADHLYRACANCLWCNDHPEMSCTHEQVKNAYKWRDDVPVLMERKNSMGACGEKGALWTMFTEGHS